MNTTTTTDAHNLNNSLMGAWVDLTTHLNSALVGKGRVTIIKMEYSISRNSGIIVWEGEYSPFGEGHRFGTHNFSVHPDGSAVFNYGHYDMTASLADEDFKTRVIRGY